MKRKKKFTLENVDVTGYAAEGKAIAKQDGKVIFIEGAVPGDVADVFITKNKKDWAEGKATMIVKESPDRVTPFCIHFGVCGGCKWQMLPYEKQLEYKGREVKDVMMRIGRVHAPVLPVMGSQKSIHYRNKLEFTFSNRKYVSAEELKSLGENEWPGGALGYHVPRLYDKIIDIYDCWLMDPVNNAIRNEVRDYALRHGLDYYDIKQHEGFLRNMVLRCTTTGQLMLNMIFGRDEEELRIPLLNHLLETFPQITTLLYTINGKRNDTIHDLEPVVYFGLGYVVEELGEYQFKISAKSFFQTNSLQAKVLYDVAKDFAALNGTETVYDLYCGTGSIGIHLSKDAGKVVGVEVVEDAITDAVENACINGVEDAFFFAGDVIDVCTDEFFEQHGNPDVVIVDPPRAGLHKKLIDKLLDIAAPKIVYVSCNVATQARDLQLLSALYDVIKLQPVDMFPHTHHIECVALLKKRE